MWSANMWLCAPLKTVTRKLTLADCAIGITKTFASTAAPSPSEIVTQQKGLLSSTPLLTLVAGNGLAVSINMGMAKLDGVILRNKERTALVTSFMLAQSPKALLSATNATILVASIRRILKLELKQTTRRTWRYAIGQSKSFAQRVILTVKQGLSIAPIGDFQKGYAVSVPVNVQLVGGSKTADLTWAALGA